MIHRNKKGPQPVHSETNGQRYGNADISFKDPGSEVHKQNEVDAEMHARITASNKVTMH
jgi:hypothetical protein